MEITSSAINEIDIAYFKISYINQKLRNATYIQFATFPRVTDVQCRYTLLQVVLHRYDPIIFYFLIFTLVILWLKIETIFKKSKQSIRIFPLLQANINDNKENSSCLWHCIRSTLKLHHCFLELVNSYLMLEFHGLGCLSLLLSSWKYSKNNSSRKLYIY